MKKLFIAVALIIIGYMLVLTIVEMPAFGSPDNPAVNNVSGRYLEKATEETGVINVVAGIIIDYRAFDTLGEATVLFVALAATLSNLKAH